ncbi:NAD-glutamate dehydrogenase [uncultured Friedmanniella sp.]|uniref:NAD-glutamate dehydrogenase n=1 Tax=uncultured Friedmanniella sp. TaxID=335381 RepID=UPI0035CC0CFB
MAAADPVTVVSDEQQEQQKMSKVAEVAAAGAAVAAALGQDPDQVADFLTHYFRHVDPADVDSRTVPDLLGLVESHYRSALARPTGTAVITIRTPGRADGWTAGGATVVQVVTDDRPFLVDSLTMEVLRQGWSVREVFHPQLYVRRDDAGTLLTIARSDARTELGVLAESWMHLEILPPARPEDPDQLGPDLERGLREVLGLVSDTVQDWDAMMARAGETAELLGRPTDLPGAAAPDRAAAVALARELLGWLNADHFTYLGYREYRLTSESASPESVAASVADGVGDDRVRYTVVPGTGLGILRGDADDPGAFHALPLANTGSQPGAGAELMVVTKDNSRSRVHRPAYLDYLGLRLFDDDGRVVGERRFLGLFSSSAYSESVARVPVLRQKAVAVLGRTGYDEHSHGGKAVLDVLETYPRDELFQTPLAELSVTVEKIAHLKERRQVRMFVRADPYGRYLSCLVYLPRDRYTTAVRRKMEDLLLRRLGGATIDYTARVTESVLARLHFVTRMPVGSPLGAVDVAALERELTATTRSWDDEFADQLVAADGVTDGAERLGVMAGALPESYKEDYDPAQAVADLTALDALSGSSAMSLTVHGAVRADDEADLRLKIFRRDASMSLSKILPHLSLLGVDVIDERPYELALRDERAFVYDFGLTVPGGREAVASTWGSGVRDRFLAAFAASYEGDSEADGYNALVLGAGLDWRQVSVLRAIGRYLQQAGSTYSQAYIASALNANAGLAARLVALFETKFDPRASSAEGAELDWLARTERVSWLTAEVTAGLDDVASLDHDKIVRSYLAVLGAATRTNFYRTETSGAARPALAIKLSPRLIPDLPEPRPAFEIFVYSPRVEGVHLRFGAVARGGLRWSDRAEDFRTEILGLVKAQMVKNTVIVPVGAKGGFYARRLPDPALDREAWLAEGTGCYQVFIESLLDVTDDVVEGTITTPTDVLRYDGDDPYLVVAADKGTATFSDTANAISLRRGFWLGDAFASGGSAGYDHKAMGITARGAWASVTRHFRELGLDVDREDFTCVGIGDMSGDVFGNGMLLSKHIRLVVAFDHRHVFLDPTPDAASSWAERARLFALPRSSWADYDTSLISAGGGVYPRTLKTIAVSPELREVLDLGASVTSLAPTELISACLRAPVDLLWNGGIGTYVKSAAESSAEVGDKANDALRVNGSELRARCVGEGGNLGLTQRGRIEYATAGGRINTDFVDNSAGVDTSDHEVNIKILLAGEVAAGRLTTPDRDALLASMTDEVAGLVLAHNHSQNLALANAEHQAYSMAGVHEDWMARLEERGLLDRQIEFLPSEDELELRRSAKRGLTSPELATLLAYTKIVLESELDASALPDEEYLASDLVHYFPQALQERYAAQMPGMRLHREIITTVAVNRFVDSAGISCFHRISMETGAGPADIVLAHVAARAVFGADALDAAIGELDHQVDAATQTVLRLEVRTLVERATRWLVSRRRPVDVRALVDELGDGVGRVRTALPDLLPGREREAFEARLERYRKAGVPAALARAVAALPPAYAALTIVTVAGRSSAELLDIAEVHLDLAARLGLDRLLTRIIELPRNDRWQTMARAALRDDLHAVHAGLTAQALTHLEQPNDTESGRDAEQVVAEWERSVPGASEAVKTLRSICAGRPDLARMSVGLRVARGLLPQAE